MTTKMDTCALPEVCLLYVLIPPRYSYVQGMIIVTEKYLLVWSVLTQTN
jgi:hypothetical protein